MADENTFPPNPPVPFVTPESVTTSPGDDEVEKPHFDMLHGERINKGDKLILYWPDGTQSEDIVEVERRLPPYMYSGRIYQAYDDRALVRRIVNGAPVRVYLRWSPEIKANRA